MGVNKKAILKVAFVFFLMAFTASVEARFNPSTLLAQVMINGDPNYIIKSTTSACCDNCACTKSNPPQCTCFDIYQDNCPSTCKTCICTLPWPHATCRCIDTTDHCYDPCSSDAKSHH